MKSFKEYITEGNFLEAIEIGYPTSLAGAKKLLKLDGTFIGTEDYMGLASFWNHDNEHGLRQANPLLRKRIHNEFLKNKLKVDGSSPKHVEILKKFNAY